MTAPEISVEDAQGLIESAAEFVELTAAREAAQARVVLLARRLTQDWKLTDEEAVRAGGQIAVRFLLAKGAEAHGR